MTRKFAAIAASVALSLASASGGAETIDEIQAGVLSAMDVKADPCSDFYRFACGGWIDSHSLPNDETSITRGFSGAQDDVRNNLWLLLQDASTHASDPDRQQMGNYFSACMAESNAEQEGLSALQPYLQAIAGITNADDFLRVAGQLTTIGAAKAFSFSLVTLYSRGLPQTYALLLAPGKLGISDREIYLKKDATSTRLRLLGQQYIADVLGLLGEPQSAADHYAKQILDIESVFVSYRPQGYRRVKSSAVTGLNFDLHWDQFFAGLRSHQIQELYVDPGLLRALARKLNHYPADTLRAYLRWGLVSSYQDQLPVRYRANEPIRKFFDLQESARWKRCVDDTSTELDDLVGKVLVNQDGTLQRIPLAESILGQVESTFYQRLDEIPWLDGLSLALTKQKVDGVTKQIGFPKIWPDFTMLNFSPVHYLDDAIIAKQFAFQRLIARNGENIDVNGWEPIFSPQTVNAFYNPTKNQIHLLAGLMRASFLDVSHPLAMNYGGMGFVAAHELMHGFDTIGRRYKVFGAADPILSARSNQAFQSRAQCVVSQYSRYATDNGQKVNGKLTLEENLSDTNGLRTAFRAFEAASAGNASPQIANLSPEQLFFVSFTQNFCTVAKPGWEAYLASRGWYNYAPNHYRAIGPVSNSPDFAQAFQCPTGSAMSPKKKCTIW
ncbi:MAG: M13 family metallopeptidase [Methylococcaceae bacterium]|nr:M13 family metallopeptidase [Methylococcaceae bacterium]